MTIWHLKCEINGHIVEFDCLERITVDGKIIHNKGTSGYRGHLITEKVIQACGLNALDHPDEFTCLLSCMKLM